MAEQVAAVSVGKEAAGEAERRATVTAMPQRAPASKSAAQGGSSGAGKGAFKRGFFDAPKKTKAASQKGEDMPFVKAQRGAMGSSGAGGLGGKAEKAIPDFMRVEQEPVPGLEEVKQKVTEAMKPTKDMMGQVMSDAKLMAGFDDPEVMAAVQDVASNPGAISKYKDNKKVLEFYQAMAGLVGDRLTKTGEQQDAQRGQGGAQPAPPPRPAPQPQPAPQREGSQGKREVLGESTKSPFAFSFGGGGKPKGGGRASGQGPGGSQQTGRGVPIVIEDVTSEATRPQGAPAKSSGVLIQELD
ncbi:unnamed protein product [Pedinophyceae sp. YPF-701]|nr:unnamed protein product [Pedinophyceae sp. YPF-701]